MKTFDHLPRRMPEDFTVAIAIEGSKYVARLVDAGDDIEIGFEVKSNPIDAIYLARYVAELRHAMWSTLEIRRLKRAGLWREEAA